MITSTRYLQVRCLSLAMTNHSNANQSSIHIQESMEYINKRI